MEYSICKTNPNIPLVHRLSPWAKITKQSQFFSETSMCGACSEPDPRWQKNQNKPKYPHFQAKIKVCQKIERSEIRRSAGGQTQIKPKIWANPDMYPSVLYGVLQNKAKSGHRYHGKLNEPKIERPVPTEGGSEIRHNNGGQSQS